MLSTPSRPIAEGVVPKGIVKSGSDNESMSGYPRLADPSELWDTALVAEEPTNRDWKCLNIAVSDKVSGAVIEYKVHLYRKTDGWYDEVRYDSHEIKRGRKTLAPHLHVKLATVFKDPKKGEEELKQIINRVLPEIEGITQ